MPSRPPRAWPAGVLPPPVPGWERSAQAWLLDLCPPEYRGHPVLVRHPVALALLAGYHVRAALLGCREALAGARADLTAHLPTQAVEGVVSVLEHEQERLVRACRAAEAVERALREQR